MLAGMAYFIFKIYRIYDPTQAFKYKFVKEFLTFFGKHYKEETENPPSHSFYSKCVISLGCIDHY